MHTVQRKIVGYAVKKEGDQTADPAVTGNTAAADPLPNPRPTDRIEVMARPEKIEGTTYKIRNPLDENAMYITINDIVLNAGDADEVRRPYEIFINSKNMEHFQWIAALTLVISAVFRKGGDMAFLVDELKSVFDPRGGYWKPGAGIYMSSVVAHIGTVLEDHLQSIGVIQKPLLDERHLELLAEKRAEYESRTKPAADEEFPATASLCAKCSKKSVIIMDGCATCLNCGDSKCG